MIGLVLLFILYMMLVWPNYSRIVNDEEVKDYTQDLQKHLRLPRTR